MSLGAATVLVYLFVGYGLIGVVFSVLFVFRGVDAIDPAAASSGAGFRLMILPGAVALWPLLLWRWVHGAPPPDEVNAHRQAVP